MNFKAKINELKKNGVVILPNVLSKKECENYILIFEKITKKLEKSKKSVFLTCQLIDNPFRHEKKLINLMYDKQQDKMFSNLLDKDYVLISSTLVNRKLRPGFAEGKRCVSGANWHSDSRYLNKRKLTH